MPAIKWTRKHSKAAQQEGWDLFERDDGYYEIERCDDDPEERFTTDQEALDHVSKQARGGSLLHQVALHLDETKYPQR